MTEALMEEVVALVRSQLGQRAARPDDRLVEDLGVESTDLVMIVAALEERYAITVPEQDLPGLRTVADLADRVVRARGG